MLLSRCPVTTSDVNCDWIWRVDDEFSFMDLVDLLFGWDHFKFAYLLGLLEERHVKGTQARLIKTTT